MKIYIVIKAALQEMGEFTLVSTEKAFQSKDKAEAYVKTFPSAVWNEKINSIPCVVELAIHEIELE